MEPILWHSPSTEPIPIQSFNRLIGCRVVTIAAQ